MRIIKSDNPIFGIDGDKAMKPAVKNITSPDKDNQGRRSGLGWLLLIGLPTVGAIGVVLVLTAPLTGSARSSVGASLVTGAVVGLALLGFEASLDSRRSAREAESKRILHQGMMTAASESLAMLIGTHVEWLYDWFAQSSHLYDFAAQVSPAKLDAKQPEWDLKTAARPPGWTWPGDVQEITHALMWRAEVMRDHPYWWQSELDLAMTDAVYFVASDLSERFDNQPDEWPERIATVERRTAVRLSGIAQRLSESGNARAAAQLDAQAESLQFQEMVSYAPHLSLWGNEYVDTIIPVGEWPLEELRNEFAWLTAELRERKIAVDRDGDPVDVESPSREQYRWGPLLSASDNPETVWDDRFTEDSWFRRLTSRASGGLSHTKLGRLAGS
jgi:hypothetical protein